MLNSQNSVSLILVHGHGEPCSRYLSFLLVWPSMNLCCDYRKFQNISTGALADFVARNLFRKLCHIIEESAELLVKAGDVCLTVAFPKVNCLLGTGSEEVLDVKQLLRLAVKLPDAGSALQIHDRNKF